MRRLITLLAAGALALSACTADDPTIGASPGAAQDDGGGGGNQPPPEVQPEMIPEGESTAIAATRLDRGTDPTEEFSGPRMVLVRNRDAGRRAAENAPVQGAAEILRDWDRYAERALIAVYGASQPDSGHRIRLGDVSVTKQGRTVTVFAEIVTREPAAEVVSMPWMVLSVPASLVALAERCILAFQGLNPVEGRC